MTRRARVPALLPLRTTDRGALRAAGAAGVPTVVVSPSAALAPPAPPMSVGDWRRDAACADSDPELFFPLTYGAEHQVRPARRICGRCPVRAACLADVMATEDPARRWGVYGGLTPGERTTLHRAGLTVASAPTVVGGAT